jgi:hypothetical protein
MALANLLPALLGYCGHELVDELNGLLELPQPRAYVFSSLTSLMAYLSSLNLERVW